LAENPVGWYGKQMSLEPSRGDVWTVSLDPAKGREHQGRRPALVLSVDPFNHGPADLIVVVPITSKAKGIPFHVRVTPPEGGLKQESYIKCEDVRSISKERLLQQLGAVTPQTMKHVEDRVRILLGL
jgi:mRNA interferase MazF